MKTIVLEKMMRITTYAAALASILFATQSHAILVTSGDVVRTNYDLSGATADGPYSTLGLRLRFCNQDSGGSSACQLENTGDSFRLSIYATDDSLLYTADWATAFSIFPNHFSQNLPTNQVPGGTFDNIGYVLILGLTGSFELTEFGYFGIEADAPGYLTPLYESVPFYPSSSEVPEPGPLFLLCAGLLGLAFFRQTRAAKQGCRIDDPFWRRKRMDSTMKTWYSLIGFIGLTAAPNQLNRGAHTSVDNIRSLA